MENVHYVVTLYSKYARADFSEFAAIRSSGDAKPVILVVDDEPVNSKMVEVALKRAGMTVMLASDGADAVNIMTKVLCDEMKVDLILMDMYMKHMNGDDATLKIRELEAAAARSPVPIIALSGGGIGPAGTSDSETVYKAGMQGLVLNCEAFV